MEIIRVAVPARGFGKAPEKPRLNELLRPHGIEICHMGRGPWRPEHGDALLVNGNVNWYPAIKRQLLSGEPSRLPPVVIWHSEPLPPPRASGLPWPWLDHREIVKILLRDVRATDPYSNYWLLRRLHRRGLPDKLFASTWERVEFLRERGISAEYLPLGHYDGQGCDLGLERDIPVLFLGGQTLRRRIKLAQLRLRGIDVHVAGDWENPSYWGEARTRLINRAKIFLNIPRFRGQFAMLRFTLAASNKALIVSEPLYNSAPFVAGKHYVAASEWEMPEAIRHYLAREEERKAIVENAYRLATEECRLSDSIRRLAESIRELFERSGGGDTHTRTQSDD